ncbi:unnamed protein product [Thlaspi arvense]|uniref:Sigma factor n=1 Tax=Thlaspi arvense TaxID=13288 RepID=A0AAU9SM38_THLAR|nr:unnamed protein product [Thlaspi arvense]
MESSFWLIFSSSHNCLLQRLGMGVVTVSSSASRTQLGLSATFSSYRSPVRRPTTLSFKRNEGTNTALVAPHEPLSIPVETTKENQKRRRRARKSSESVKALSTDEALPCTLEMDYNEAAAKLENIYKLSPVADLSDVKGTNGEVRRGRHQRRKIRESEENMENKVADNVVRNRQKKPKRLNFDMRIALRKSKDSGMVSSIQQRRQAENEEDGINKLVREYSVSTDLVSLDWKKMKIPSVLPSSEHTWLFKLMQPMKVSTASSKGELAARSGPRPTDGELAEATNMNVVELRRQLEVGRAARNKLIKHNLRLVLFVINKYFQEFANGPKFQDLCQAGVKGLITAIDRFEPKRRFRLSTYGLFWIRHAIIRSMTVSSFTRVPFGLESIFIDLLKMGENFGLKFDAWFVGVDKCDSQVYLIDAISDQEHMMMTELLEWKIQRAKLELLFELQRTPTEEEITEKVGISPERYHEVMRASKPISSLHAKHAVTQEEFIDGLLTLMVFGRDNRRQPALLRLALDDVLDSLKPKESLVIRQRYGLDGKGDRTLGEIAGNLNISREMVRKHEVKALMKLKHPARVDYLRRYVF